MAKQRTISKRSRTARRAASPTFETDKALKDYKPPARASAPRPSVLAIHQSAGIDKKPSKRGRKSQLSSKARRRQERGLQMAEAIERSKTWDSINKKALDAKEVQAEDDDEDEPEQDASKAVEDKGWETDEDMGGKQDDAAAESKPETADEGYLAVDADDDVIL
uniref:Ribosome biogenesis protein Alb1 n=1 Tax=Bionectria ochroleuca TaxID=29856 RepID=A0A0B7JUW0_BIOOC